MRSRSALSARTLETYDREIRRYSRLFEQEYGEQGSTASPGQIRRYVAQVAVLHIRSDSSMSVHIAALKQWYYERHGTELTVGAPRRRASRELKLLGRSELSALLQVARSHPCGKMIRLICTGVRLKEVLQARVSDLDTTRCTLTLRDPKGSIWRTTAIPAGLKYELYHETFGKKPDDYLFAIRQSNGEWRPVSPRTVQSFLANAGGRVGLPGVSVQTLRENLIVRLLRWGLDSRRIAELIGVKNQRNIARLRELLPDPAHTIVNRLEV